MLFDKEKENSNERIIHETRPNFFFQCKKSFIAFIALAFLLGSTSPIIKMIGELQVYMIDRIKLPLTSYTVIAIVVIVLILIFYIFINIMSWYSTEYTLTNQRISTKKGIFISNKNYMPYQNIQDVSSSQNILGRIFRVSSISSYSAYDNNHIKFENVSNGKELEEIIFNKINSLRFNNQREIYPQNSYPNQYPETNRNFEEEYPPYENGEYYPRDNYNREEYYQSDNYQDEFIKNERYGENQYQENPQYHERPDYNQYPQYQQRQDFHENDIDNTINEAMRNLEGNTKFKQFPDNQSQNNYIPQEQRRSNENYYPQNQQSQERYYENQPKKNIKTSYKPKPTNLNEDKNKSPESVLERHSKKFKR